MDFEDFKKQVSASIPIGTSLSNPGGGTSTIMSYSSDTVTYRRRNSPIPVSLRDLFDAYEQFNGGRVSSSDLKKFNSHVFDSDARRPAGHSCNCTFLFMVLREIGIVDDILGHGVSGDPFFVILHAG